MPFPVNRRLFLGAFFALFISGWVLFETYAQEILCGDEQSIIECAYKNPSVIYVNEFQQYPILDSAFNQISLDACRDLDFLTATLAVGAGFYPRHVHYSEEMQEVIDKLLISDPECFMRSLVLMDQKSRVTIGEFLKMMEKDRLTYTSGGLGAVMKFSRQPEYRAVFTDFK